MGKQERNDKLGYRETAHFSVCLCVMLFRRMLWQIARVPAPCMQKMYRTCGNERCLRRFLRSITTLLNVCLSLRHCHSEQVPLSLSDAGVCEWQTVSGSPPPAQDRLRHRTRSGIVKIYHRRRPILVAIPRCIRFILQEKTGQRVWHNRMHIWKWWEKVRYRITNCLPFCDLFLLLQYTRKWHKQLHLTNHTRVQCQNASGSYQGIKQGLSGQFSMCTWICILPANMRV